MAKTVCGMVIGSLVDEGRIKIEERLVDIFPEVEYKDKKFPLITVEHLLTMTSGVDFAEATAQIEGDHMAYTTKNTYASYLVDFADGCDACTFRIRAAAPNNEVSGGGVLEVRLGDAKGELLGSIDFEPTGEWANYREFSVGLEDVSELYDEVTLTLVFLPEKQYLLNNSELMFVVEFDEPKQPDAPVDEPTPEPEDKPEPPEETPTEQPDDQPTTPQPEKTSSATPWLIGGAAALVAAIGGVLALLVGKKKKER
jgi:hypothetical protein